MCRFTKPWHPHTAHFQVKIHTHTRHISTFFQSDLRLLQRNTVQDEGISTNSQTQHWRTTNIWLVVTSLHSLFYLRSQNRVNEALFFKPWWRYYVCCTKSGVTRCTPFWVLYLSCMCRHLCASSQFCRTFIPSQYLCGRILVTSYWQCGTGAFQEQGQWPFIGQAACFLFVSYWFPFLYFHYMRGIVVLES